MNHNPYETWLFTDEILLPEQQVELREHIDSCEYCRQLNDGRNGVEWELRHPSFVSPLPGFSSRWRVRLEQERQRIQRRQSLTLLGLILSAAFLLIAGLIVNLLPIFRIPSFIYWTYLYQIFSLSKVVDFFENAFLAVYLILRRGFNLSWVFGFSPFWVMLLISLLSALTLVWFLSIRKLTMPKQELVEIRK